MKSRSTRLLLTLLATLASLALSFGSFHSAHAAIQPPTQKDLLLENYEQPKNIMFASMFGGASHVTWMLDILDELYKRGHNITFVTKDVHKKFVKPYPHFNTIVLNGKTPNLEQVTRNGHFSLINVIDKILSEANQDFETDYTAMKDIIETDKIDVAVCDLGGSAGCYEAAVATKTPYAVSGAYAMTSDTTAPYINNLLDIMQDSTTLNMNFKDRFVNMFIKPIQLMLHLKPLAKRVSDQRQKAGCNLPMEGTPGVHRDALKLVNSLYGIEAARPMGPLVEMVGPIIPLAHAPLTPELKQFLETHSRIIYLGFGQHVVPTARDLEMILTAVMENIENGIYDGFLWAARLKNSGFPESVTTRAGNTYNVNDMFDHVHPHTHFIDWAPQTAILMHPNVSVFLTHGGAGSFYEGLYSGKRLVVFPFFGDQYTNAFNIERNKLGDFLRHETDQAEANALLERVGRDVDGIYQKNVNRYKALVQIHSRHGITRGADLIEEVAFVSDDEGLLPYRYEVSRQMSYIKSHNIDLFAAAAMIALSILVLVGVLLKKIVCRVFFESRSSLANKQKKN